MSLVELRVELPAYSRSFNVQVPFDGTIFNVKQEIFRSCPGNPRVEGQKLIWRGRYLTDEERVNDLWKSHDEPRIVHLAVHPSGWSSAPPPPTPSSVFTTTSDPLSVPPPGYTHPLQNRSGRLNGAQSTHNTSMDYIQWKHDGAICVLLYGWITPWSNANDIQHSRSLAVSFVQSHGYQWPIVLDEEFPTPDEGGMHYEQKTIDGLPYLCLVESTATPTACQLHAIKILSYTFSLLSLNTIPTPIIRPISNPIPANGPVDVNTLLQHLGLPALRVQEPQGVNNHNNLPNRALQELREIPVRPLLVPLLLLVFRTCLLLYFVAPTRKPVFGLLILVWMLYEIWQPIRNAVRRNLQRAAALEGQGIRDNADAGRADGNNPVNVPEGGERRDERQQPNVPGPEAPLIAQPQNAAPRAAEIDGGSLLDTLGSINLDKEQQILNMTPGTPMEEPIFWHRLVTFLTLLVTTTHPAVWDRRRAALRQREGQLRMEVNLRNRMDEVNQGSDREGDTRRREVGENARRQHGRRPDWVRRYIERVLATDWLDDGDIQ
ncbi:hypothetical protein APHAL10511_002019 [Amanita phalloides]|nr:hypothetical protein APHAL10511_002019 [Amanita phalloides]